VRTLAVFLLLAGACAAQQLKTREEAAAAATRSIAQPSGPLWVVPAGTRIPIQLRQPLSTKNAQPGDPVYAQTTFPIMVEGGMAVPAGTWVQGIVDMVKRAGRIKGTAELQFHLTKLIYANGYSLDIAAAIDQVPGSSTASSVKEPGVVTRDSEKGKDLERTGDNAARGGQIGALAGVAARPSMRGLGVGGLSGIAAGTLIAILARGSDVVFETGTAVEIALSHPMAVEVEKISAAQPAAVR
jgi:hypothetical protein